MILEGLEGQFIDRRLEHRKSRARAEHKSSRPDHTSADTKPMKVIGFKNIELKHIMGRTTGVKLIYHCGPGIMPQIDLVWEANDNKGQVREKLEGAIWRYY